MAEITVTRAITVSMKEIARTMTIEEFCELLCEAADRFDDDFATRARTARELSDHFSENGVRLLAEIVTSHHMR